MTRRQPSIPRAFGVLLLVSATAGCGADHPGGGSPAAGTSTSTAGIESSTTSSSTSAPVSSTIPSTGASTSSSTSSTFAPQNPTDNVPPATSEVVSETNGDSTASATPEGSASETSTPKDPTEGSTAGSSDSEPSGETASDKTAAPDDTGPCEYPEPPESVAAWVDESWNEQLGDNIRGRSAWLLDNVIKGEGELNVCVRWGASNAPSTAVKAGVAPAVERWMNDWFKALGTYGCFPYADGIDVKVTGWAVRPGNEAWVSDLDQSIAVYTELDGEGEPKCPDTCSFFVNWGHEFPNCPGGAAFHTDYWIWVSDALPGGGGAAAVGGDWGLRMPVASFEDRIDSAADLVIEHEIGHGFGFQDYYDWTGSTPSGGSLMIVGSTSMQSPTVGDTWLLRRTWREMQMIRNW